MHDAGLNPAEASTYALKMVDNKEPPPWLALVGVHALHWHDHPKNTREFTSLLGTKDYEVQRSEKRQKTGQRAI